MNTLIYNGEPRSVTFEASIDAIVDADLNTFEGEHFDTIQNVIRVESTPEGVEVETVRSLDALKRGEPNAGRGVLILPHGAVERVIL